METRKASVDEEKTHLQVGGAKIIALLVVRDSTVRRVLASHQRCRGSIPNWTMLSCVVSQVRLQRAQNSTARLAIGAVKIEHITPVLNSLHWLPAMYRSQYKILVHAHKALHESAPQYSEELVIYHPTRSPRFKVP